nr:hypothetical protein Itr_chr08CG16120 [Ipomoea trifida]
MRERRKGGGDYKGRAEDFQNVLSFLNVVGSEYGARAMPVSFFSCVGGFPSSTTLWRDHSWNSEYGKQIAKRDQVN